MKARIIETNKENNNYLTEIGSFPFLTEKEVKDNCTEEPTRMRLHPGDIEAFFINIHPEAEFQKIIGFGGAFTDTAAHAWKKLSEEKREKVGKKGVVREKSVHMEVIEMVTDFALHNGFHVKNLEFSPVKGPEGNIEYLVELEKTDTMDGVMEDISICDIVEKAHEELDK